MIDCFLRFVGTVLYSCCDPGHDIDHFRSQPNKRETQNRHYYYQYNDTDNGTGRFQTNRKTNQNSSQVYQYDVESYRRRLSLEFSDSCSSTSDTITDANSYASSLKSPARSNATPNYLLTNTVSPPPTLRNASLSNNLVGKPRAFSSDLFLNLSKDINSHPLSKIESNAPASSRLTKSIQSSPSRPDAVCLRYTIKPATSPSMQGVPKSNMFKNSPASKPIPAASPTPKVASSPINSTKQTNTSHVVQSDAKASSYKTSASQNTGPGPSRIKYSEEAGKGGTQRYAIPKHIEEIIRKDIVPPVLKMPLLPETYSEYFAALLYAEDYYYEKWSDYLLEDVTLQLLMNGNSRLQDQFDNKKNKKDSKSKTQQKNYPYVAFKITHVPERRPYLLSRDHVHLKPLDKSKDTEPFHGVVICVKKSTTILAEFDENFHRQHESSKKYDVSFSFNRVCLKRAHRAVSAATNPLLCQILFPKSTFLPSQQCQVSLTDRILSHKLTPIPYLIEDDDLHQIPNRMINLIKDTVLKIYESCNESRVLICAPKNSTCDELMTAIMENVQTTDLFRANAAFRERVLVPGDVMPACFFGGECFTCPPLHRLKKFRIITSTFISTFRLYNAGLKAGHFSHIFLVEATFAIEPEVIVALADLVSEETVVVVTGFAGHEPYWVRSDIGRRHGLSKSFFERLLESEPYLSGNLQFITRINQL